MCVLSTIKLIYRTHQKQKWVIGVNMVKVMLYILLMYARAKYPILREKTKKY